MRDDRKYRILLKCGVGSVWVINISHSRFIDGIQNGGLKYFNDQRHKILNFTTMTPKA